MLVTALCTACFSMAKINKKLWDPPTLRFGPPTKNALAPALVCINVEKLSSLLRSN